MVRSEGKFLFANGAECKFRHLDNDADAEDYQGHSYTLLIVEEIGNFPSPTPIQKLMATLRSGHGVPCQFIATGNPGGPGHPWVKARYIDPAPLGLRVIKDTFVDPFSGQAVVRDRVFIPANVRDNNYLNPAECAAQLRMVGSEMLVRAWLYGDWSIVIGAFFGEFDIRKHVIRPFEIPRHWPRFRAGDWGSARPFAIGWFSIASDYCKISQGDSAPVMIPRGAMIMYREWYGCVEGQHNVGLKLTVEEVADGIMLREKDDINPATRKSLIKYAELDPSCFANIGGPTHAERFAMRGLIPAWTPARNQRTNRDGRLGGWDMVRHRLKGEDGHPMIDLCPHMIRTLPALQHDAGKPEDLDGESEDHLADCLRYGAMSRPYIARGASLPSQELGPYASGDEDMPVMRVNLEPLFRAEERRSKRLSLSRGRIQ
jgi:hypothetical protein